MAIISRAISDVEQIHRFKAPVGMMYEITDIMGVVQNGGVNVAWVLPFELEDERGNFDPGDSGFDAIAAVAANDLVAAPHYFHYSTPVKTKWITMARRSNTAFKVLFFINYSLITVSKTDLILEWFRKGR